MSFTPKQSYQIIIVEWFSENDGLADVIEDELIALGHSTQIIRYDQKIPKAAQVVFTFGPYGKYLQVVSQLASIPESQRPTSVHWNTEGLPDLRLPWFIVENLGAGRSWVDRLLNSYNSTIGNLASILAAPLENRILRFRYVGDYYYAYHKGLLHVYADSSEIFSQIHNKHGLPTVTAPWGATNRWFDDLGLERDIDVLWMGQRGSRRRSRLLDRVREELRACGVEVYMADNQERPFIYSKKRTEILNRAKITLNLTRTWFDDNFSRFAMACPNRSLVVSEPLLSHCSNYKAGFHYISAPVDELATTILNYLKQDDERLQITENAYQLVTSELTFRNSIKTIIQTVDRVRQQKTC